MCRRSKYKDVVETWGDTPVLDRSKLEILQRLRRINIFKIVGTYIVEITKDVTLIYEVCDLGSALQFADNNKIGNESTQQIPIAFAWHIFSHSLRVICYLAYGYRTIREVLETSGSGVGSRHPALQQRWIWWVSVFEDVQNWQIPCCRMLRFRSLPTTIGIYEIESTTTWEETGSICQRATNWSVRSDTFYV